jgi:ankyrin repeat protein
MVVAGVSKADLENYKLRAVEKEKDKERQVLAKRAAEAKKLADTQKKAQKLSEAGEEKEQRLLGTQNWNCLICNGTTVTPADSPLQESIRSYANAPLTLRYTRLDMHGKGIDHSKHRKTFDELVAANDEPCDHCRRQRGYHPQARVVRASGRGDAQFVKAQFHFRPKLYKDSTNDVTGETALMVAAANGEETIVETVLMNNPRLNLRDDAGRTALIAASDYGHLAVAEMLVDAGAGLDVLDRDGMTALMWACQNGHTDIVALLLQGGGGAETAGAMPNVRTSAVRGLAALHYAAASHHAAAVSMLLDYGADVNVCDNKGMTALMHGGGNGAEAGVHVLLERGYYLEPRIDLTLEDRNGRSAADVALRFGHERVAGAILEAEAKRWQNLLDPAEEYAEHGGYADFRLHVFKCKNGAGPAERARSRGSSKASLPRI